MDGSKTALLWTTEKGSLGSAFGLILIGVFSAFNIDFNFLLLTFKLTIDFVTFSFFFRAVFFSVIGLKEFI